MKEKIILLVEDNENDIFLTQRALVEPFVSAGASPVSTRNTDAFIIFQGQFLV
jgi:hypothetical protein